MNAKKRKEILEKMAEGYTVTEKKTVKSAKKKRDGTVMMTIINEEVYERYIPPNLKALELLDAPKSEF